MTEKKNGERTEELKLKKGRTFVVNKVGMKNYCKYFYLFAKLLFHYELGEIGMQKLTRTFVAKIVPKFCSCIQKSDNLKIALV